MPQKGKVGLAHLYAGPKRGMLNSKVYRKIAKTEEKVEEENPYFPSSYDVRYFYYPYGYYRY